MPLLNSKNGSFFFITLIYNMYKGVNMHKFDESLISEKRFGFMLILVFPKEIIS